MALELGSVKAAQLCKKPLQHEYPAYAEMYLRLLPDRVSLLHEMAKNCEQTIQLIQNLTVDRLQFRYAVNKWTIKDIVLHIIDDERIYAYRALRFARGDATVLPGFDQDAFAAAARADARSIHDLVDEFRAVRHATISLFAGFDQQALERDGIADGKRYTVRALAYHIAGHELHHVELIRSRYV